MTEKKNDVVLIGDDHHNALNLVRSFGVNGIAPDGIIICTDPKKCFISKSKYWHKTYIVKSYDCVISVLNEMYSKVDYKIVLIPCSDKAAQLVDSSLNSLKDKFIIPTINMEQKKIVELMDKESQVIFAQQYDLPIAKTKVLKKDSWISHMNEIDYPCIVKPVSSYEGEKSDICKCENSLQLHDYLNIIFNEKKYTRILVQKYIDFDYEIEFVGSFSRNDNAYLISKTYRGWPVVGGTNSYFGIIDQPDINTIVEKLLRVFTEINFCGLFDIELFKVGDQIYLNEINWRNTGNSFFCLGTDVHYAVVWYYDVTGKKRDNLKRRCTDTSQYAMNEATDFRYVVFEHYPFKKWNAERKKTKSFALWFKEDKKPARKRYRQLFFKLLKGTKK